MTRRELVVVPGGAITPDLLSGDYRHGDAATGKRRLQQVTMPGTSTALATFSYDLAGRMTRVGLSAATDTTMAFDAFDRVRVVDEPGSGLTQHRYDAAGERATTVWADGRIERYFGGGLTQREGRLELHVGLGGARVVARVNVPELPDGTASISDGLGGAPAVVYLHQGVGHGPTVVTDGGGEVLEERVFEPYGTPLWVDADYELERLGWNGKAVDPSTGWSDHGARWHATRFARWLSVDPPLKGPGGLVEHGLAATPYGFVAGNPVVFWDPDGLFGEVVDESVRRWNARQMRDSDLVRLASELCVLCSPLSEVAEVVETREIRTEVNERGTNEVVLTPEEYERSGVQQEGTSLTMPDPDEPSTRIRIFGNVERDADGNYVISPAVLGGAPTHLARPNASGHEKALGPDYSSRSEAFRAAKRDAGIPMSQRPSSVLRENMTDKFENNVLGPDGRVIVTRVYSFDNKKVLIQEHSAGHEFFPLPHFNVRPSSDPRHGHVPGTKKHYSWK